jgi:Pentapeptide repeats (8 copies)
MVAAVSALAAVATSAVTGYATNKSLDSAREQLEVSQEGQVTDRFGRATEQLGSNAMDVRLGAIYSLERLMGDSPPDQPTVMEVLSAYVREHTAGVRIERGQRLSIDIQAALTVLGRRDPSRDNHRTIELAGANLTHTTLSGAHLGGAHLAIANLTGANLIGAHLGQAFLGRADLTGANLTGADLTGANLTGATLTGATLVGAHLERICWDKTTRWPTPKPPPSSC